jgi:hypothetical protein
MREAARLVVTKVFLGTDLLAAVDFRLKLTIEATSASVWKGSYAKSVYNMQSVMTRCVRSVVRW